MINLLPKEDRLKLSREYTRRLMLTWGTILLVVLLSFLILETSFYLVLWHKRAEVERGLEVSMVDAKPAQFDELEQALSATGEEVAVILTPRPVTALSVLLEEVVRREAQVSGVVLGEMTFDYAAAPGTLSVRGAASTRQSFLNLVKTLSESDLVETVDYPVNNLINDKNIRFTLAITLSAPKVMP